MTSNKMITWYELGTDLAFFTQDEIDYFERLILKFVAVTEHNNDLAIKTKGDAYAVLEFGRHKHHGERPPSLVETLEHALEHALAGLDELDHETGRSNRAHVLARLLMALIALEVE